MPHDLTLNLTTLFRTMEAEFSRATQMPESGFITTILSDAQKSVGTCIDRIKIGYVLMQLHCSQENAVTATEKEGLGLKINTVNAIIDFISDINLYRVVFDTLTNQFVKLACTDCQDGDTTYHISIPGTRFTTDEIPLYVCPGDANQLFIQSVNLASQSRFYAFRISYEVEDILYLTYRLIPDSHQFDLRFDGCRTLREETHIQAAIEYCTQQTE